MKKFPIIALGLAATLATGTSVASMPAETAPAGVTQPASSAPATNGVEGDGFMAVGVAGLKDLVLDIAHDGGFKAVIYHG